MPDKNAKQHKRTKSNQPTDVRKSLKPRKMESLADTFLARFDDVFKSADVLEELDRTKEKEAQVHPSALKLMSKVPSIFARGLIYVILLFLAGAVLWASLVEMDVVVKGEAILLPEGKIEQLHSEVSGRVVSLKVAVGDVVNKGDTLLTLSARDLIKEGQQIENAAFKYRQCQEALRNFETDEEPQYEKQKVALQQKLKALEELIATNDAIIENIDEQQTKRSEQLSLQKLELSKKKNYLLKELQAALYHIDSQINERKAERKLLEGILDTMRNRTHVWEAEYLRLKNLASQKLETESRVTTAKAQYLDALSQYNSSNERYQQIPYEISSLQALKSKTSAQYRTLIAKVEADIKNVEKEQEKLPLTFGEKKRSYEKINKETKAKQKELDLQLLQLAHQEYSAKLQLKKELEEAKMLHQQAISQQQRNEQARIIRAPIAGVVTQMPVERVGMFIKPGDLLAVIAAPDAKMVAQITVKNQDIGEIVPGKKVKLKFAAYPYQDFGLVNAKVIEVDPDATYDEEKGPLFALKASFDYKSILAGCEVITSKYNKIRLKYGMLAQAEIVQRQQTVMSIILAPLRKLGEKMHP